MRQTIEQIELFAEGWYAAWNDHDLDRILLHYREDVVLRSPLVPAITGREDTTVFGRDDLADYFGRALEIFPDLRFEPVALMFGAGTSVLHYRSVGRLLAVEAMGLDGDLRVIAATAYYDRLPADEVHLNRTARGLVRPSHSVEIAGTHQL